MILEIITAISIFLNVLLAFYAVKLARRMFVVGTNLEIIYSMIESFLSHTEMVHESEMFYGDPTLQSLIEHSKELLQELENYDDLLAIVIAEEEGGDEEKEE
jgi:hypothetical protein